MLALAALVVTVGLVDSLNPGTILPALYFAVGRHPTRAVGGFVLGFFATNFAAGVVLTLGPGRAVLRVLPRPGHHLTHLAEIAGGILLVAAGAVLWLRRRRLNAAFERAQSRVGRAAPAAGAVIALVELPTAVPYLGVIVAIIGSDRAIPVQIALVALFNLAFVVPLLVVLALTLLEGSSAQRIERIRGHLQRHGGSVVAGVTVVIGLALLVTGVAGAGAG